MSYNGSGTFSINTAGQPVITGTVISSTAFNALTADLATGLSTAITKDGQTTTTSRILFAQGISSTLVTDATSTTTGSIITAGGISTQKALWVGTTGNVVGNLNVGGTNNVATGVISVGVAANAAILINGRLDANTNTYGYQFVNGSAGTAAATLAVLGNGTNALQFNMFGTAWTTSGIYRQGGGLITCDGPGGLTLATGAAQPIYFGINNAEVARFDTSGRLLVATTTAQVGYFVTIATSAFDGLIVTGDSTSTRGVVICRNTNGTVGSITTSGSSTAFNTSSDYRLKENVQPMTGGLAIISALKPVTYDWICDKSAGEGFIAHELQSVIPLAVTGEKDAVDDKGEIKPQGVDFGKIVPHLVAAIQELTTRLAALENKT